MSVITGIRQKLALSLTLAVLPLFLLVSLLALRYLGEQAALGQARGRQQMLAAAAGGLEATLASARADLRFLSGLSAVHDLAARGAGSAEATGLGRDFLAAQPGYAGIWVADAAGTVLLRLAGEGRQSPGDLASRARDRGDRQCLAAVRAQPPGQVYVSPIIWDRSLDGSVPRPRVCLAAGLADAGGRPAGAVGLDLDARWLFQTAWPPATADAKALWLVLEQGGALVSLSGAGDGPAPGSPCEGILGASCRELLTGRPASPSWRGVSWRADSRQVGLWPRRLEGLVLVCLTPATSWLAMLREPVFWLLVGGSLAAALLAGLLAFGAAGRLTEPLGRLAGAMERLGRGERQIRLPEQGGSEMARTTAAFNRMAETVGDETRRLEERVRTRTRELTGLVQRLRRGESRLKGILDATAEAIVTADEHGVIQSFNRAAEKLFGYRAKEVVGQNVAILQPPPHREQHDQYLKTYLETGRARVIGKGIEARGRRKDGGTFPLHLAVSETAVGNGRLFTAVMRDLSALRRAEEAAHDADRLCRELAANLPNACVLVFDRDLRYSMAEGGLLASMDLAGKEVEGRTLSEVFDPGTVWLLRALYRETLAGESAALDIPFRERMHEVRLLPIRGTSGEVTGGMALVQDITDAKRLSGDLGAARQMAEDADRVKSEFLANMSHELRTPLNAVIGFAEVLSEGSFGELNDPQRSHVQNIAASGRHLLALINDLLDLSRAEGGQMTLETSPVPLGSLLDSALGRIGEAARRNALTLMLTLSEELRNLVLTADERKLRQVLANLLDNAVKFTPEGGCVTLEASRQGDWLCLGVRDTGIGLEPRNFERVFERFVQVDSSYDRQRQGTGLGLALTRRLVELHGGRIWVESKGLDQGSLFCFTLPLKTVKTTRKGGRG